MTYKDLEDIMKKFIWAIICVTLLLFGASAFAAQTSSVSETLIGCDTYGKGCYAKQKAWTATATTADETACVDIRAYEYCDAEYTVTGTINVDLDWRIDATHAEGTSESESDDITATGYTNFVTEGGYFCYDVDSATTATWSLELVCYSPRIR